jgi:hypothetical protein
MNDKEFTQDLKAELLHAITARPFQAALKDIQKADDSQTFRVIISTSDEDRQGDKLDMSKWNLANYKANPVVLWAHDYYSPPIATCTNIYVQGDKLIAEGKFAPSSTYPFAGQIAGLYQDGYVNTTSVGFIIHEDGELELLEFSFVPVPANPFALSMRDITRLNLNTAELVMKGLRFTTKGAVPYADHGNADPDTTWHGPAQVKACGDDMDKLKSICAWFDSENPDVKSSYKLPHHEADGLKAVLKGVEAAGAAISGARGGVDIPDGDLASVKAHLSKHYKAFGKSPPWEEKAAKTPQVGDSCQLDDGTPGVLAENPNDPGQMICVPPEGKAKANDGDMNNELINKLKSEHDRHAKSIGKAIDEFSQKSFKKAEDNDNTEMDKAIDEFETKMDDENADHLTKCMKAIDDNYQNMGSGKAVKAIDEFKDAFTAEHTKHVKALDKAIDEFKSQCPDDPQKAIDNFTTKSGAELDRHEKAHMDMCKAEAQQDDDEQKTVKSLIEKLGAEISAKNKEKLKSIMEKMDSHHTDVIAALKELVGDEGTEPRKDDKSSVAPNERPSTSGAVDKSKAMSELEAYLTSQRLVRQAKSGLEEVLTKLNREIKQRSQR